MLSDLSTYYNDFVNTYSNKLDSVWKDHIFIESTTGKSEIYTSPANYKYFFYIFYSIKSKMKFDTSYGWSNVLTDYDVSDIVKKMYCHDIKFSDFLDIFNIPTTTSDGVNILVTVDRIWFTLKDGGEDFVQSYKE